MDNNINSKNQFVRTLVSHDKSVTSVAFSSDGSTIVWVNR